MEQAVTANGTVAFFLPAGLWIPGVKGTLDAGASIALKAGHESDGSDHDAVTDKNGTAIAFTSASTQEPSVIHGGTYYSVVTTGYGSSADVFVTFRKAVPAG